MDYKFCFEDQEYCVPWPLLFITEPSVLDSVLWQIKI